MANIAILLSGQPRLLNRNFSSIINLIKATDATLISCHFWSETREDEAEILTFQSSIEQSLHVELILNSQKPLDQVVISRKHSVRFSNELQFRTFSQFYSLDKAYQQLSEREDITHVLRVRSDLFCPRFVNIPIPDDGTIVVPYRVHGCGTSDISAIATKKTFGVYANFIEFVKSISGTPNLIDAPEINLSIYLSKFEHINVTFDLFNLPAIILRETTAGAKFSIFKSFYRLEYQNRFSAYIPNVPKGYLIPYEPNGILRFKKRLVNLMKAVFLDLVIRVSIRRL